MISGNSNIPIELYKELIDNMSYAVLVADPKGNFIFWNTVAYNLFKKELVNSPMENWVEDWGVFSVDKKTKYETTNVPLSRALRGEFVSGEKLYIKTDNREGIYIKVNAIPIHDNSGNLKAAMVMCEDITKEQLVYESIVGKINELEAYLRNELNVDYDILRLLDQDPPLIKEV